MADGHKLLPASESEAVPTYADFASLPVGSNGDLAVTLDTGSLYEYNGTAWQLIGAPGTVAGASDTNTVDMTLSGNVLSAVVKYQDSTSIDLSEDSSGLKAALLLSSSGANSGFFNASSALRADGLQVEVPQAGVRASPLTGYSAASGTVASTDTILQAFNKLGYFASINSEAQIVTVASSGAMFTTIQGAIDSITDANSTTKFYAIHIAPGVYTENIIAKAGISLVGESNGPAAPTIVGTITGTTSSGGDWILLNRINHAFTVTGDGQKALSGAFLLNDYFCSVSCAGDYAFTGVELTGATYPPVLFSANVVISNTYAGSTKSFSAVKLDSTAIFSFINSVTIQVTCAAASGTINLIENATTAQTTFANNVLNFYNSRASFAGTVNAIYTSTASVSPRTITNHQIVLMGTSGGTANALALNSGGSSANLSATGNSISISGFTTQNSTETATTDVIKTWLQSQDGDYGKSGAGLSVVTPYDANRTGFIAWGGSGNYWSITASKFKILRPGIGCVKDFPVPWVADLETGTLTDKAVNFVYITPSSAIGATVTDGRTYYNGNITKFKVWRNGTDYLIAKDSRLYEYSAAIAYDLNNQFGPLLTSASTTLSSVSTTKVAVTGANTISDYGISSTVAAETGGATWSVLYTATGGEMALYSSTSDLPAYYNNAGTPTVLTAGSNRWIIYRLGCILDNGQTGSDNAQYVALMDTVQNTSGGNATTRINSGLVATWTSELKALGVVQLGYAVVRKTSGGAIDTSNVPPTTALQIFGAAFVSGGTSTSAALITADATNFDKNLSGSDTNVQTALTTFDEFNSLPNDATNASASPDIHNKTAFASSASGTSATFTFDSRGAIEFLVDVNTDGGMVIACDYKATTINALSDPSGLFLATDAGTGIVVTKSANSAAVTIKNRTGATKTIGVLAVRSSLTATAWS